MRVIWGILIIVVSGALGHFLDVNMSLNSPPLYWFLGVISGALGITVWISDT